MIAPTTDHGDLPASGRLCERQIAAVANLGRCEAYQRSQRFRQLGGTRLSMRRSRSCAASAGALIAGAGSSCTNCSREAAVQTG